MTPFQSQRFSPPPFSYWQVCLHFVSFDLFRITENLLPPPYETFKTKTSSKLALQSADYCSEFTQSK